MQPGDILRGARHREGLTQAQLATMIGVKPSHISEMEKGKRPIGKDMAKRLAKALNTSYRCFYRNSPESLDSPAFLGWMKFGGVGKKRVLKLEYQVDDEKIF